MKNNRYVSPPPGNQRTGMRCKKCRTPFITDTLVNVAIDVWAAHMQSIRCPECGSKELYLGMGLSLTEDREMRSQDPSIQKRINDWLENGEVGQSSKAVLRFFQSEGAIEPKAYPHDYSDLRRVILLLDRFPELASDMHQLGSFKGWEPFVRDWNGLVKTILEADPEALSPKSAEDFLKGIFNENS